MKRARGILLICSLYLLIVGAMLIALGGIADLFIGSLIAWSGTKIWVDIWREPTKEGGT